MKYMGSTHGLHLKLCFLMALIPHVAMAYDFSEGGLFFNFNKDGKSVTFTCETPIFFAHDAPAPSQKGYIGDIVIPSTIKHDGKTYKVTAIDEYAFTANSELRSVKIPESVIAIGQFAFMQCFRLESVELPSKLTSISDYAFAESGLKAINIPSKVKRIGTAAFNDCYLKSVDIPNSVTSISDWTFADCTSLTSIDIPNSVTAIGNSAFRDCTGLTSIVMSTLVRPVQFSNTP